MVLWCDVHRGTYGGVRSKLFTMHTISSLTNLEHSPPYVLSMYSKPLNHTAYNNI